MRAARFIVLALAAIFSTPSLLVAQQAATVPVVITITDPSGAGAAHAHIRIIPSPTSSAKMETDDKGRLALDLKPGGYALFASVSGFKTLALHFDVREPDARGKEAQTVSAVLQLGATGSPQVSPASSKDDLAFYLYPYHEPTAVSTSDFKAFPHITVSIHNSHTNADETYSGVRLADLLGKFGAPLGNELRGEALSDYIVATGSDGYSAVLALAEVDPSFHSGEVIVADAMNGKPLDTHSGPFKLVVTEDRRPARSVRNLVSIELRPVK